MTMLEAMNLVGKAVEQLRLQQDRVLIAIDGRCAAGKTTFAAALSEKLSCPVFHLDDFFLRPEQQMTERRCKPGGNVDHERFLDEVLLPLYNGSAISYRPYDCHSRSLKPTVSVPACKVAVIEGTYACCPSLYDYYDLRLFLDVEPSVQKERLLARASQKWADFQNKWIPLEEQYHQAFSVKERCDFCFTL